MRINILSTLISLYLITTPVFSQKRIIRESPLLEYKTVFESKPLIGDSILFWRYDSKYKEWNSQKGSQYNPEDDGQNFTFLKSLMVTQDDNKYYIIIFDNVKVHKLSLYGMYALNSNSEYAETNTCYFVTLTQKDIENIKDQFELKNGRALKIVTDLCGTTVFKDSYSDIHKNFNYLFSKRAYKKKMGFWIEFQNIEGKDIVRFRLPEDFTRGKGFFKKNYYEISIDEIYKLIPFYNKH